MEKIYRTDSLLSKTIELSKKYGISPARSKGQNFLIEENVYNRIIEASDLNQDDVVLEVGPGLGFLTKKLASQCKKVIAVELDDKLANALRNELETDKIKNVEIINEDILRVDSEKLKVKNYKVVANLPYNITSIFLRKFLSGENKPGIMVLMLQKEVAERIAAKPGKMSLLGVSAQFYSQPEIISYVPADNFWPKPEVDSAIIKLNVGTQNLAFPRKNLAFSRKNEDDFFRLVKIGFSAKRKMLKNNLAAGYHIDQAEVEKKIIKAGFDPKIRAQELSVDDWKKIAKAMF